MKYLLPSIFYPDVHNEESRELIHRQLKLYDLYLKRKKSKIDQELYNYYHITDRFHDYNIDKIIFYNAKKNEKSFIELEINFYNDIYYKLTFFQIKKYIVEYSPDEKYYEMFGKDKGFEDIILCEIGYEKGYSFINLHTADESEISIYFKQFEIEEITKVI